MQLIILLHRNYILFRKLIFQLKLILVFDVAQGYAVQVRLFFPFTERKE